MSPVDAGLAVVLMALGWTLWVGVRRRDAAITINAGLSLVAVGIPSGIELLAPVTLGRSVTFQPLLSAWIAVAGLLHMVGMISWYDTVWWWDHVTHTVSSMLIAAVGYAWVLVGSVDTASPVVGASPPVVTILLTITVGVVWELAEQAIRVLSERIGIEQLLKQYGRFDTPLDIVFDAVGAVVVVGVDLRLFVPLFEPFPGLTRQLVVVWMGGLGVGLLVSCVIIVYGRLRW